MESNFILSGNLVKGEMPDEQYHSLNDMISASHMKVLKRSPAHYREYLDAKLREEDETTEALEFGSAYHCYVLEPEVFAQNYFVLDDTEITKELIEKGYKAIKSTKDYKLWLESTLISAGDRKTIGIEDYNTIQAMRGVLMKNPYARMMLTKSEHEVAFTGTLETTAGSVPIKMKLDILNEEKRLIADLKTTRNADAPMFAKSAADTGLQIQSAFYSDMMEIYSGASWSFFYIAQEKYPPYAYNIFEPSGQFVAQGRYEYELLISLWKYCKDNDTWPGYQAYCQNKFGIVELNLPAYMIRPLEYYIHKT